MMNDYQKSPSKQHDQKFTTTLSTTQLSDVRQWRLSWKILTFRRDVPATFRGGETCLKSFDLIKSSAKNSRHLCERQCHRQQHVRSKPHHHYTTFMRVFRQQPLLICKLAKDNSDPHWLQR